MRGFEFENNWLPHPGPQVIYFPPRLRPQLLRARRGRKTARSGCALAPAAATLALGFALSTKAVESPVTISVDTKNPGPAIPQDFTGLSFKVLQLLPNADGVHYFRPDNTTLISLFHTLGIKTFASAATLPTATWNDCPAKVTATACSRLPRPQM